MAKIFKGGISSWLGLASRKLGSRQSSSYMKMSHEDLDPTQLALLNEPCIAVDLNDQATGSISKKDAHLLGPENQLPPLHRAFSVFLFFFFFFFYHNFTRGFGLYRHDPGR